MADNERVDDHSVAKKVDRPCASRNREQRATSRVKDKGDDSQLPVPPPDPWTSPWCVQNPRNQTETAQARSLEEDEDIIAYLTDLGTPPLESQASECPSRNSATSTMVISNLCAFEDAFEHLDRLYAFTEQILELRSRSSKFFKRVRNLEKLKALRNADRRLENAYARDKDAIIDICDEDTGFAESLLDAMLSNCRDPPFQRRYTRSSSSRQSRTKFDIEKQTSVDEIAAGTPKISKWTRVKAAFKWERACANDTVDAINTTATVTPVTTVLSSPTPKYHRNPDSEIGESNSNPISSHANEACDLGMPFGRTSSASSSNEGSYDCSQKSNHLACQPFKVKVDKKVEDKDRCSQSLDDDTVVLNSDGDNSLGKPLIRVTSEKNQTVHSPNKVDEKDADLSTKRFTPTLTITIPSQEEEVRFMSSPDSSSPLPSSAHTSGGNSPQPRKMHREFSINKDFKRQQSTNEELLTPTSKSRPDSKWSKVRRAFLTNSTLSVPPNLIRVVSRQMILQEGLEASLAYGYSDSAEDLRKSPLNSQIEARRDYRAVREKLGTEFQRKLIEWERLKNLSPRMVAKDSREIPSNLLNARENLLSEERLAPEFRKKLQDWKRTKKERRGSAPFEQQRLNRRRLTDWQLWRSPSKSEYRNKENVSSRSSCEENVNDTRSHLGDDFVRKMEMWKRINDTNNRDAKTKSNRLKISPGVDESEFLALEGVLWLFDNGGGKGRRESDARRLDECFNGDTRPFIDGTQNMNDTNEVLIRTSVGSYRFEGISREFTRKLYDWERYRGISPTSSTFRLLGPTYDPFTRSPTIETSPITATTKVTDNEPSMCKNNVLKRSKSAGSVIEETVPDEFFIRRSTSLQTLGRSPDRLKNNERINTFPISINSRRTDMTDDIAIDDSEPEAMIVDIEDVIEETASPLERVQPHQTPVYSVAASETTSIAVPLGTVTSSHEPSPVFLIEIEENEDRKHWESKKWIRRKSFSSEDSLNTKHFDSVRTWNNKKTVSKDDHEDSEQSSITESLNEKKHCVEDNDEEFTENFDKDLIKSDDSVYSMELDQKRNTITESEETVEQNSQTDCEREEMSATSSDGESVIRTPTKEVDFREMDETTHEWDFRNHSAFAANLRKMMTEKKALMDKAFSSKVSFTIAQSQLATCRYNQDLSSQEQDHEGGGSDDPDRTNDRGKDINDDTVTRDNEYEEIQASQMDPRYCSSVDKQPRYIEERTKRLLESTIKSKADEAKLPSSETTLHRMNRVERFNKHEETYGVIRENRDTCINLSTMKSKSNNPELTTINSSYKGDSNHRLPNNNTKSITGITESSETIKRQYNNFENASRPLILCSSDSCSGANHREPTIKTIPCTVSPCREERCYERIIINEKTLNKIVVPTASTGCIDKSKDSNQSKDDSQVDESEANNRQSSIDRETVNQEGVPKKRVSPSRNVFIKTKRIIFSPFRRVEENSASKNEDFEDDHFFRRKSKSKSRSASPKINRQDVLLRMSFSLPWPLRPSSKDRELKETKIKEEKELEKQSERRKSIESRRKSSTSENSVSQSQIKCERKSSIESTGKNKESVNQQNQRVNISVQTTSDQTCAINSPSSKIDEKKSETSSLKFDPNSSDLIHKLKILSNAVATRDGRTNTICEESSLDSHSLRVRRAKEDFLSRRGGPLCHSVMEPRSFKDYKFPERSTHHYERILENQRTEENENSLNAHRLLKLDELSSETREEKPKNLFNDLPSDSIVSRPDRVKSASVGMINIDPDTFVRLTEANRGCESLPRSILKQQEPLGPLAKIVSKFTFGKLIRGKDIAEGNMSTISKLCRQSLLIDVQNDSETPWEANNRKEAADNIGHAKKRD